ncbi:MAG: nicotinate phosphoribosyltransferase [Beijerinckiaceae bacterium]|nr:nicotinate phosphoribosyltransferase [Beijerinckiaceae bacterium]MCI0737025.1 nicotinate phosphoribosyltransferase [Beijerinckiaceae bacterium]
MSPSLLHKVFKHSHPNLPAVRSLLDTDFYKLLMLQMIWRFKPATHVTFAVKNRSPAIRLADTIGESELAVELDQARGLRFKKAELAWLASSSFYGKKELFDPDFLDYLASFRLPPYELSRSDGEFELRFPGLWRETTLWEVPALAILSELFARALARTLSPSGRETLYACGMAKLRGKVKRLRVLAGEGPLSISDFGTRRRHSFSWQRWCVETLREGLGESFIGTSNVKLAMDLGLEAIGTNAHELPMVYAALTDSCEDLRNAPFRVLEDWAKLYDGKLRVLLPDTFGTANFLAAAPDWAADWAGARPDSRPPIEGAEELIAWWKGRGRDPATKLVVLSDAMTVEAIEASVRHLRGRAQVAIGWGTNLTNDFSGCWPGEAEAKTLLPSIVCKVVEAEGRPAVKLSDNPGKFLGPPGEIARYERVFLYRRGEARPA